MPLVRFGRLLVLLACMTAASVSHAQSAKDNEDRCSASSETSCTWLIESGLYSGERLAFFYAKRGAYRRDGGYHSEAMGDFDEAIRLLPESAAMYVNRGILQQHRLNFDAAVQDYTTALALQPSYAQAHLNRGASRLRLHDLSRAMLDFNAAISIQPKLGLAYWWRGAAHYSQGEFEAAAADFDQIALLNKSDPRAAIMIYLARVRAGRSIPAEMENLDKYKASSTWPAQVIPFLQGARSEVSVRTEVLTPDSVGVVGFKTCELDYYVAQQHFIVGDHDQGSNVLRQLTKTCAQTPPWFAAAELELRRLDVIAP